jgi:integrase
MARIKVNTGTRETEVCMLRWEWEIAVPECINNKAWQHARARAAKAYQEKFGRSAPWGFEHVRVHDLKHTSGRRLRAAGVDEETRKVLLGHTNGAITTHYSAVEIAELIQAVNRTDRSLEAPAITLLKVAA